MPPISARLLLTFAETQVHPAQCPTDTPPKGGSLHNNALTFRVLWHVSGASGGLLGYTSYYYILLSGLLYHISNLSGTGIRR